MEVERSIGFNQLMESTAVAEAQWEGKIRAESITDFNPFSLEFLFRLNLKAPVLYELLRNTLPDSVNPADLYHSTKAQPEAAVDWNHLETQG